MNNNYQKSFSIHASAAEVRQNICSVDKWWTNSFTGSAERVGDKFTVTMGNTFVDFTVVESNPEKMIWRVTDCHLHWLNDKKEWKDTHLVWEIVEQDRETTVTMTHEGLVPEVECYEACKMGWDQYAGVSLPQLLNVGKGLVYEETRAKVA